MGFRIDTADRATIWYRHDLSFSVGDTLFDPLWVRENTQVRGAGVGRGQAMIFTYHDKSMVLRYYRRGGMLGRLNKDLYLRTTSNRSRGYQELNLLAQMQSLKLPVPNPFAARFVPSGIMYRADILIEEIPSAKTFFDALRDDSLDAEAWASLGGTIARFHANGIDHTDLNIRNILLDQNSKFWLIDFDKCSRRKAGGWSQSNLARLKRSIEKEHSKYHFAGYTPDNWHAFIQQYNAVRENF